MLVDALGPFLKLCPNRRELAELFLALEEPRPAEVLKHNKLEPSKIVTVLLFLHS